MAGKIVTPEQLKQELSQYKRGKILGVTSMQSPLAEMQSF
jgi:hypothetical protein